MAEEYGRLALNPGLEGAEVRELREGAWNQAFVRALESAGRRENELQEGPANADWKLAVAERVRSEAGASLEWLSRRLEMRQAATLRSYLHKRRSGKEQGINKTRPDPFGWES
jgi:hypothetical protein